MIKKREKVTLIEWRKFKNGKNSLGILEVKKEIVKRLDEGKAKDMNRGTFQMHAGAP